MAVSRVPPAWAEVDTSYFNLPIDFQSTLQLRMRGIATTFLREFRERRLVEQASEASLDGFSLPRRLLQSSAAAAGQMAQETPNLWHPLSALASVIRMDRS